jgi:hypothetical protein
VPVDVGGEHRLKLVTSEIRAKFGGNEGQRQRDIGGNGRDIRLPLATSQRIAFEFGFYSLHESRAALANSQAQAIAPKRPLGRIVVD